MSETKNVQMKVDEVTHNLLRSISQRKKMPLEDIVKDAITEYIRKYEKEVAVEKDAIFELIGSFETKEGDWSERDDWRE
jgi:DNA-binding protein Fis